MGGKRLNSDEKVKTVVKEYLEKEVDGRFMTLAYKNFQIGYKSVSI
jgi:hypothetical protein